MGPYPDARRHRKDQTRSTRHPIGFPRQIAPHMGHRHGCRKTRPRLYQSRHRLRRHAQPQRPLDRPCYPRPPSSPPDAPGRVAYRWYLNRRPHPDCLEYRPTQRGGWQFAQDASPQSRRRPGHRFDPRKRVQPSVPPVRCNRPQHPRPIACRHSKLSSDHSLRNRPPGTQRRMTRWKHHRPLCQRPDHRSRAPVLRACFAMRWVPETASGEMPWQRTCRAP